jgi:hypothetical protein
MAFLNCTPHEITIMDEGVPPLVIPPSGVLPRLAVVRTPAGKVEGVTACRSVMGETAGLPAPVEGVTLIVSALVAAANTHRQDLVSPGEAIRGPNGQPIGCQGVSVYWKSQADGPR